jgi:hypothetical protein
METPWMDSSAGTKADSPRMPNVKAHTPETATPLAGCRVKESACLSSFPLRSTAHQLYDNLFLKVCHYPVRMLNQPEDIRCIFPHGSSS